MRVWIWVEQSSSWEEVCSCSGGWASAVRGALEVTYLNSHVTEAQDKPTWVPEGKPVQMAGR